MATAKRTPKQATSSPTDITVYDRPRPINYAGHIIVHGDPHWKANPVYRNGLTKLSHWLVNSYPGATIISTGDQTDTSGPDWATFSLMVDSLKMFASSSSEGRTYYLDGNHTQSRAKGSMAQGLNSIPGVVIAAGKHHVMEICGKRVLMLPHLDWNYAEMQKYDEIEGEFDLAVAHAYPKWVAESQPDAISLPNIKCPLIVFGHVHYHRRYFDAARNRMEVVVPVPQATRLGETGEDFPRLVIVLAPDGLYWMERLPEFMTIERVKYDSEPVSKDNLLVVYDAPSYTSAQKRYSFRDGYFLHEDATEVLEITAEDLQIQEFEKISNKDITTKLEVFALGTDLNAEEVLMAKQLLEQAKTVQAQQAAEVA